MAVTKDDIKVGDTVKVSYGYSRDKNFRDATVTAIARVWLTVEITHFHGSSEQRFRLDTQTDSTSNGAYQPHFYTMKQWERREASLAASKYLREQGISITGYSDSPWYGREVELAEAIKKGSQ